MGGGGVRSAPSVQRVEEREPEIPTSQPRFKINDLLNIAPDTGKMKRRLLTTLRWGNVMEDPVWVEGKWMYRIRLKSEGWQRDYKFEEDILSFKVKEQDPAYLVSRLYNSITNQITYNTNKAQR